MNPPLGTPASPEPRSALSSGQALRSALPTRELRVEQRPDVTAGALCRETATEEKAGISASGSEFPGAAVAYVSTPNGEGGLPQRLALPELLLHLFRHPLLEKNGN